MESEENKRVVERYMALFGRSDIAGLLDMMSDDATWTIVGKPHLFDRVGTKTKTEMAAVWHELYGMLDGDLEMKVIAMIAEEDRVAAQVESHARTKSGKIYANEYHFLIVVRDGKIAAVREYTDLMHAAEVFG